MRGSVSDVIRCRARCAGRWMSVFGRSILRIITAWSTFAAIAGPVGDLPRGEAPRDVLGGAGDDQLPAPDAQLARRRHQRLQRLVGHLDRLRHVHDQPAHALHSAVWIRRLSSGVVSALSVPRTSS